MTHERDVEQAEFRGVVIGKLDTILFRLDEGAKRMSEMESIQKNRPCAENTQAIKVFSRLAWTALGTSITVGLGAVGFLVRHFLVSGKH